MTGRPAEPDSSEITRTECTRCGTEIYGIDGRYSCPLCGWVNHWSEGHNVLPGGGEDPDLPGRA